MAISPLAGPQMPDELKVKYLSPLTFPELCEASLVCKNWFEVSRDDVLWKPIFKELSRQYTCNAGEDIKTAVLRNLHNDQKVVNGILSLIDDDKELALILNDHKALDRFLNLIDDDKKVASILNCPFETVQRFPKMLPLERTWHVMRGLSCDCTELFKQFPEIYKNQLFKYSKQKITYEQKIQEFNTELAIRLRIEHSKQDTSMPLFTALVKSPPGPFDAGETICTALTLFSSCMKENIMDICAFIVKSHPNLSEFFKVDFNIEPDDMIPMTEVVSRVLIPELEKRGVTIDDWIECGYKPPGL